MLLGPRCQVWLYIRRRKGLLTDWSAILDTNHGDIDTQATIFNDYLKFCIKECIPTVTIKKVYHHKPWINSKIKPLLPLRNKALANQNQTGLRSLRSQLQREMRQAKFSLAVQTDCKFPADPKSAWSSLKSLFNMNVQQTTCFTGRSNFEADLWI